MTSIFCANLLQRANTPKLCFGDESATPYAKKNSAACCEFFIKWTTGHTVAKKETIYVIERSLPDQLEETEDEAVRKGLPDACIFTENGWILIIESKVAARISINQLNRHINTLKNRGFTDIQLLVINTDNNITNLPEHSFIKTWSEIYEWGYKLIQKTEWAKQFTGYFEVAEAKMIKDEYLKEGTLTRFTGIHFDNDNPYSYIEAKRLLKLLMGELKTHKKLIKEMGIDPHLMGRGAITGKKRTLAWDYLSIREAKGSQTFTQYPHISIGIHNTEIDVAVTIPHGVKREIFNNIFKRDVSSFNKVLIETLQNMMPVIRKEPRTKPVIRISQTHFPSRSGISIKDAKLEFDLRTAFQVGGNKQVKQQKQWLNVAFDVMCNKKSNMQFQVVIDFSYDKCKTIKDSRAIDLFAESIIAMKPFLDMAMGRRRL